jgi:hypothetical protein
MKQTNKSKLVSLAVAAGLSLTLCSTNAALLMSEPFDYADPDGTSLTGLNGGVGFSAAYPTVSGVFLTNGLSYPGAYFVGKGIHFGASANISSTGRAWGASPTTPLANGVYYYSYFVLPEGTAAGGTLVPFMKDNSDVNGQNGFGGRVENNGGSPRFKAWSPSQAGGNNLDFAGGYGATYLVMGKLTINQSGDCTNTIWVYKSPDAIPTTEPASGGSTVTVPWTGNGDLARTKLSGRAFSSNPGLKYDQVRVGTTFADVIPPSGPAPTFSISPASAIENQTLTFNWADIPGAASAIVLNPGAEDLLPLTTSGAGSTTRQAPAVNTQYVLTYTVAGVPTSLTNQYTAVAPFFTITPAVTNQNRNLTLAWRVPVGSNPVTIGSEGNPPDDYTGTTSPTDGSGSTVILAPGSSTNYILSYTYNAVTLSITQQFTLAPASFTVPNPAIENGVLPLAWSIPLGFSSVFIEYGPAGGPFTSLDVTAQTDAFFGTGTDGTVFATLVNTNFTLRYTNSGIGYAIATNISIYPQIFTNLVAANNTKPVQINAAPMQNGVAAYSDRTHVWAAVPSILQGAQFVKFGQDDKFTTNLVVSFNSAKSATFFLLLDNRIGDNVGGNNPIPGTDNPPTLPNATNSMAWVVNSGFVDSGVDIGLDENPVAGTNTIDQSYSVYFRQVAPGETFTFFEQYDLSPGGPGGRNMYGVAGVSPQVIPVAFIATDLELTNGQSTTLQWTVPAGSTVSINNGIGDVTALTDLVFGTGSTNIVPPLGTNNYTLTYDPPGPATPPVNLGPLTVVVYPPAIADYPTNITYSVTGNTLALTWPATHQGWYVSSNSVNVADTNFWFDVPNSETGTSLNVTIDPSQPNVFYRLRYP